MLDITSAMIAIAQQALTTIRRTVVSSCDFISDSSIIDPKEEGMSSFFFSSHSVPWDEDEKYFAAARRLDPGNCVRRRNQRRKRESKAVAGNGALSGVVAEG